MNFAQTLTLLSPELVLLVTALALLGVDLISERWRGALPFIGLAGVLLSLVAALSLWGTNRVILSGMVAVDDFAILFKVIGAIIVALLLISSHEFMARRTAYLGEFYALLVLAGLSIALMAGSNDLIMVVLSVELLSITSYVLTGYLRDEPLSSEGGLKYLLYGALATGVMIYGLSLLYGMTGQTELGRVAGLLGRGSDPSLLLVALPVIVLITAGFGFKVAVAPFHQWSPDAYEGAPAPVTAFLSVGPKVGGFAVLLRVFLEGLGAFEVNWTWLLALLAVVSMTLGNVVAIWQRSMKRMLAYSSIAQAGYLIIGAAAASHLGTSSLAFYALVYALANLGAFITLVAYANSGVRADNIREWAGLSRRSPALALAMLLFLLSLAGIPPLAGFVGKLYLFLAAMEKGLVLVVILGVLNSVVSLYYYLNVAKQMYVFDPHGGELVIRPSWGVSLAIALCALGVVLLGVFPGPTIAFAQAATAGLR